MNDLRVAMRLLRKAPGFSLIAVLTLAIGIGVNTATFSLAQGLLLRPLDLPDIDRLVMIYATTPVRRSADFSPPDFLDLARQTATLEHAAAFEWWEAHVTGTGEPERVQGFRVSPAFFQAAGVQAMLGRTLLPGEDGEDRPAVTVLSHNLWLRRFGGDPRVVGTRIELNSKSYQIAGVMPKNFHLPRSVELWVPLTLTPQDRDARGAFGLAALARLKPGVTVDQAQQDASRIASNIERENPQSHKARGFRVGLLRENVSGDMVAEYTRLMWAVTLLVMLIACVNVANLQFARASSRYRELAVRTALGASRFRLLRQLTFENIALGLLACAAGLLLAAWGLDVIKSYMPPEVERFLPGWSRIGLDRLVLAFLLVFSIASAIMAGILPAWTSSQVNLTENLRDGARGSTSGAARHRLRSALIVLEVALAAVLLVGAGLILRGFRALVKPVSDEVARSTLTLRVGLMPHAYKEQREVTAYLDRALERISSLPGVEHVAVVSSLPYSEYSSHPPFVVEGAPPVPPGRSQTALRQNISSNYFRAIGLRLTAGREFQANDKADSLPVAIISERLAKLYFEHADPIGRRIAIGRDPNNARWMQIVGIAADVPHRWDEPSNSAAIYVPYPQGSGRSTHIAVRGRGDAMALAPAVRSALFEVDRNQPIWELLPYDRMIHNTLLGISYVAWIIGISAVLALILAVVGIYSVMANAVGERTHEIGVRMALGADRGEVMGMIVRHGMMLAALGMVIAIPCAYGLARLVSMLLVGSKPSDPPTYVAMAVLLLGTAFTACVIPARRATAIDPVDALRHD